MQAAAYTTNKTTAIINLHTKCSKRDLDSEERRRGAVPFLDAPPGDEPDHAEGPVDDVHDRRRVVAGRAAAAARPTRSTAIQISQNSTQPRAMPYVARIEPVRIQASAAGPRSAAPAG